MKKLTFIVLMFLTALLLATPALGYEPMVPIPGAGEITDISDYIKALYLFGLAIVGVIAMLFIIIGGIRYMTAAGNQTAVSEAKSQITAAILGLVLVLTSWLILNTINPELVSLKKLVVEPVNIIEKETVQLGCDPETYICVSYKKRPSGVAECTKLGEPCWYYRCNEARKCEIIAAPGISNPTCRWEGQTCSSYAYYICDPVNEICVQKPSDTGEEPNRGGCTEALLNKPCPKGDYLYYACETVNGASTCVEKKTSDPKKPNEKGCSVAGQPCPEANDCNDRIDNDGDGEWDRNDPCCTKTGNKYERHKDCAQCDNGKDDDEDGKRDYPADPGCTSPEDSTEWEGEIGETCENSRDCDLGKICKPTGGGLKHCVDGCYKDPDCPKGQICQGGNCIDGCRKENALCFQDHPRCPNGNCTEAEHKCCDGFYCEDTWGKDFCRKK